MKIFILWLRTNATNVKVVFIIIIYIIVLNILFNF